MKGQEIPCYISNGSQPVCCRVALVENVSVPPESEIIVLGKPLDNVDRSRAGLVEPHRKFVENTGLMVARVLVDPKNGNIPLRLANMRKEPITVRRDTVTAVMQAVESVSGERVNVSQIIENDQTSDKLPEHLKSLFERSSENLDESQQVRLKQFLIKHQDIFSKSSSDIGHTALIQHHIDVQDAKPVKKAPYRIPLAKRYHWHHYLYGTLFTVRSDHGSLRWLLNFKILDGQLARMLTFLSAYNFTIEHRAGRLHSNCDALSRRPCYDFRCKYCDRVESKFFPVLVEEGSDSRLENSQRVQSEPNRQKKDDESVESLVGKVGCSQGEKPGPLSYADIVKGKKVEKIENVNEVKKTESSINTQRRGRINATKKSESKKVEPQPGPSNESNSISSTSKVESGSSRDHDFEEIEVDWEEFDKVKIRELQLEDRVLKRLHAWIERGEKPEWSEIARQGLEVKYYWQRLELLCVREGVMYRRWE